MSVLGLNSGKHVLVLSFSGFDPTATLAVRCGQGFGRSVNGLAVIDATLARRCDAAPIMYQRHSQPMHLSEK